MSNAKSVEHPGKLLQLEITRLGMNQKELAIRTGASEKHISTLINGNKNFSSAFARKLDIALGSEKGTWAKRQADYDEYVAELEAENGITDNEFSILKQLKNIVEYFLKCGIMHNHCGDSEKVLQLREILRVNDLSKIPQITYNAAYRAQISTSTSVDPYVLFAWQRLCEICTEKSSVNGKFNREKLLENIPAIKKQMFETNPNQMIDNLKKIFGDCGVSFEVVHHFRGAPVQGFIKQTENDRVILCLTIRGKQADRFWFSLFHEIGHLVNGDLNLRFVDFSSSNNEAEAKADNFARDAIIEPMLYKKWIAKDRFHSIDDIKAFSNIAGVPYWITIGRLHNDEWLDWSYFAHETPAFEWVDD